MNPNATLGIFLLSLLLFFSLLLCAAITYGKKCRDKVRAYLGYRDQYGFDSARTPSFSFDASTDMRGIEVPAERGATVVRVVDWG